LDLQRQFVFWPDANERAGLEFEGLPGCVGMMDGTDIKLEDAPCLDSESYYDKNKVLVAVTNYLLIITVSLKTARF
jgi:hypothetical protein